MEDQTVTVPSVGEALPSGSVTFLLTDVAGSTPLWEKDATAMAAVMARHNAILREAVVRHGGVHPLEQGEGDSMVAAFARAGDAIRAALDGQLSLGAEQWSDGMAVTVRMALHTADAMPNSDARTYQGTAIIRCARLRALAHGGQIVVSSTTAALATDALPEGTSLRELGLHALKGLRRPELVWQLIHPGLRQSFPPLVTGETTVSNVPLAVTAFFGQATVLADVEKRLEFVRLVTLTGAGGCGKTRVAGEVARRLSTGHVTAVWWVELAPASSADEVVEAVARVLSASVDPGRSLLDSIADCLAGVPGDVFVVLDNCEHVVGSVASVVERLLQASPRVRVVTTSREPLGITGEAVIRVPSLGRAEATNLFTDRVGAAGSGRPVGADDRAIVQDICERLDGIPLAIELAAARVRTMSLQRLAAGLDDAFRLLSKGSRTAPARQQTMRACVAWSIDQLDDVDRVILRRLAVFVGKFSLEAAVGICASDDIDADHVTDAIDTLVDKSLVGFDPDTGRYFLLELIRQDGQTALLETGELADIQGRHARWFCGWVGRLAPLGRRTDVADEEIALDHANVAAAIDHALAHDRAMGLETLACLSGYFNLSGRSNEAARRFVELSTSEDEVDPLAWARAVSVLGLEALWAGVTDIRGIERAVAIAADRGDQWTELFARYDLAVTGSFAGDLEPVKDVLVEASGAGFDDIEMYSRLQLASMYNMFGHPSRTLAVLDGVPARMRDLEWDAFVPAVQGHCAVAVANLGRSPDALALVGAIEPRTNLVGVLLTETYRISGLLMADPQLLALARAAAPDSDWIWARIMKANVAVTEAILRGDFSDGTRLIGDLAPLLFTPAMLVTADELLAPCFIAVGDLDRARSVAERLEGHAEALGSEHAAAAAALARAAIALVAGEDDVLDKAIDAVRAAKASESRVHLIDAAELLVVALSKDARLTEAARLDGICQQARVECCYRWRWPYVESLRTAAPAVSGPTDRLDVRVTALTLDEATAVVLENAI